MLHNGRFYLKDLSVTQLREALAPWGIRYLHAMKRAEIEEVIHEMSDEFKIRLNDRLAEIRAPKSERRG